MPCNDLEISNIFNKMSTKLVNIIVKNKKENLNSAGLEVVIGQWKSKSLVALRQ